jgi:hypothetical protein
VSVTKASSVTEFIACLLHKLQPNVKRTLKFHSNSNRTNYSTFNQTSNVRKTWHGGAFAKPMLQWKSSKYYIFWVCVCRLKYPACNAQVHLWPVRLYSIFSTLSQQGRDFRKKNTEHKTYRLIFSTTFTWKICHSTKNWPRYGQKCKYSRQIFELN